MSDRSGDSRERNYQRVGFKDERMTALGYVYDDEHCLGFIEQIGEARWRAAGAHRTPSRIWIYEIGFFPTPESRRATLSE